MMNTTPIFRPESTVKRRQTRKQNDVQTTYRLLCCLDAERNTDIYSLFLTTETPESLDEEFLFDISRTEMEATSFFHEICALHVTACTLLDAVRELLSR